MVIFGRRESKKERKKLIGESSYAALAAIAPVIEQKRIFDEIHQQVKMNQKSINYRPTDKLVFVVLSQLAGSQTINDINFTIRVDKPLLKAFGYDECADQSTIARTLDAATEANVNQLRCAVDTLFASHNQIHRVFSVLDGSPPEFLTIDCDLSGQVGSPRAEKSAKGYFVNRRNASGHQLARASIAQTGEIVADALYPGNTSSCTVFKELVLRMEALLNLNSKSARAAIRLRLDGGFGTDVNINWALARGYHLLVKMYSGNRARNLGQSVQHFLHAQTHNQQRTNEPATREVGWVTTPHRYGRKTRQLAIRTPNSKAKCGYNYRVIVTTDLNAPLCQVLADYDLRSGMPESSFCQSNQGLAARKRRKRRFAAQQMLMLLTQLAHNLSIWLKHWMIDAVQRQAQLSEWVQQITRQMKREYDNHQVWFEQTVTMLRGQGIKRLVHQFLALRGQLQFKRGRLCRVIINGGYPRIDRIAVALSALTQSYSVEIRLTPT